MPRTLYVSDLDGTLLGSDQKISARSCEIINSLIEKGMMFSYATARSLNTSSKVAHGLHAHFPLIVYNGVFVIDNLTHNRILSSAFLPAEAEDILAALHECGVSPIVYSLVDGEEKSSYNANTIGSALADFIETRKNDPRNNPLTSDDLLFGEPFYFTCIDPAEKLFPAYERLKAKYQCLYQSDIYTGEQWLEIIPAAATKANAILKVKELYGCDKIVSFGDGINDIPMFEISDECYAVSNAAEELKAIASGIIGSNDEDGVAVWLEQNARF